MNTLLLELIRVKSATPRYKKYSADVLGLMLRDASARRKKSVDTLAASHTTELNEMLDGLYAAGRSKYSYVIGVADLTTHMYSRVSSTCMWRFYELIAASTLESQIKHELWKRQQWTLVDYEQSAPEWSGMPVRRLTRAQRLEEKKLARRRLADQDDDATATTFYYPDGTISRVEHRNQNGQLHNRKGFARISYRADGTIKRTVHYINGILHNDNEPCLIKYGLRGEILLAEYWKNGKRVDQLYIK